MKLLIIANLFISLIFLSDLHSSVYKGQKEYMKKCKSCHGNGAKIAKLKTMEEWKVVFSNNGKILKDLHRNDNKALKYINSERFKKKSKHMLDFFVKYALDSGNVPACSD